jgi:hypothetical protein
MTRRRPPGPLLLLAAAPALAGCMDSLDRRDTVSDHAGDVQAAAIAAQAVNPWPKKAYDMTWTAEGWILLRPKTALQAPPPSTTSE